MPTTITKFIERCEDIIRAKPVYTLGASNTSKCDCIGMIKYGLRMNGVTLSTTGTNDTFRTKIVNIRTITSVSVLHVGDVVFKARKPGESGYNLPSKYKQGGTGYNGDLTDYTHIGVVKSISPLRIIHMTSPTSKTDTSIGTGLSRWRFAANLKSTYISDSIGPSLEPVKPVITKTAIVTASSGQWVKMRSSPITSCRLYDEVPVGAIVKVTGSYGDWTQIDYGKRRGWYMMTKFLKFT